jgi:hypothetical protein
MLYTNYIFKICTIHFLLLHSTSAVIHNKRYKLCSQLNTTVISSHSGPNTFLSTIYSNRIQTLYFYPNVSKDIKMTGNGYFSLFFTLYFVARRQNILNITLMKHLYEVLVGDQLDAQFL